MNKLTIAGIVVASLIGLILGFALYQTYITNPGVIRELMDNPDGATAGRVMLINLPSGKMLPVNYLHKHDKYWAAADGRWWRELREPGLDLAVIVRGKTLKMQAIAIEHDDKLTDEIFSELRPTAPRWVGALLVKFIPADNSS